MGARALYLGSTVFRVHGTNQPETIGKRISSGCFRLANGDIIDLYDQVRSSTKWWSATARRSSGPCG